MAGPSPAPDDRRLFLLLRKAGLGDRDAYTFVQELQNMAAANLIARFEAKLDAQNSMISAQNGKLDAQSTQINAQLKFMMWMIGVGVAVIGVLIRFFA